MTTDDRGEAEKVTGPSSDEEDVQRAQMDRTYLSGLAWTTASKWGVQTVTWGVTIWVARLLTPEDYGIMGMARIYLALALLMSEAGLGATVVRFRGLSDKDLKQLNTVAVLLGAGIAAFSFALAAPVAAFFRSPDLYDVILVMSVVFVITGLKVVPYALLRRDLEYRYLALVDGSSAALGSAITLIAALMVQSYWALVVGAVLEAVLLTVLPVARRRVGFAMPRLGDVSEPIRYGLQIITQRLSGYLYRSADRIVIGRALGEAPLGAYNLASTLSNAAVEKITGTTNRVTSTVFAAVQDQPREMARYLLRTTEALALVTMPASIGLGLVAPDLVEGVLGEKWLSMVVPMQILSLVAVVKSLEGMGAMVGNLRGKERLFSRLSLSIALIFPPIFIFAAKWGIVGVSLAWLAIFPIFGIIRLSVGCHSIGIRLRDYLRVLVPAMNGTVLMALGVIGVQMLLADASPVVRLIASVAAGACVYTGAMLALHRERIGLLRTFVSRLRSRS